ncbi:LuxR C-terminal-related transcriptional regulator [Cobetia marina]|jgi:LuxR family transcriptional regulator of csgAB operon|uniref:LuxR C-terminal-related transcriptional regulator n=1 Tax=Cobetia marina TaxID=28258 RepID=A0ABU9GEV9_COBMA|nr:MULTISPECIES: LuxR C-terminal-related transcriptional regulator [Cobetia]AOM02682.1 hypothetical protein BFX80_17235 [Cobetia marina]MDA5564021.1 LuxR C-terminal-related transcriptional regulator [Cobetia sp. MMG027]MDI6004565.1 LuxR C-terminal-related transcriptional regulator [Cobetia pacifica]MDO6787403.1 LuxR C-terminal-related transcriptional regulator [Cobetia marina]POR04487.1 hypothetical protein BOH68_16740 [Cobetia sp. MM1IDA2H-1]
MQTTKVLFVTALSPQTELFVDYLHEQLQCSVEACDREADTPATPNLVLIDSAQCDLAKMTHWSSLSRSAAFNVEHEDAAIALLLHVPLNGIFYRHDNLSQISQGIKAMLDEEIWLSRKLMQSLIRHYRQQQQIAFQPVMGLTQRELEILSLIATRQSNVDIAQRLNLSQHTVKSHLYNIFRKIRVHNRHQAIEWAHEHLNLYLPQHAPHRSPNPET